MTASWRFLLALVVAAVVCVSLLLTIPGRPQQDEAIVERFRQITGDSEWELAGTIPISFDTYHPQGMIIVGDYFFFSSVEVTEKTERFQRPVGGYDRSTGGGIGHLFKVDRNGNLVAGIRLGEDSVYHPGGIDFDGKFIWVPVAEYRPNSSSIVYRIDPVTMEATEVFRFKDHLGGLVFDTTAATLHGVSWGSRFFYSWRLNRELELENNEQEPYELRVPNGSHYIDYQDCQYSANHYMLCGGVKTHTAQTIGETTSLDLTIGGIDLVDLRSQRAVHQVPVNWRAEGGKVMTANPFYAEPSGDRLRFYFLPEDNESTVYVFDAIRE